MSDATTRQRRTEWVDEGAFETLFARAFHANCRILELDLAGTAIVSASRLGEYGGAVISHLGVLRDQPDLFGNVATH